jgi:CrcB protein
VPIVANGCFTRACAPAEVRGAVDQTAYGRRVLRRPVPVLALAATGGSIGALARFGVAELLPHEAGQWPWATFLVNVLGCCAAGVVLETIVVRPTTPDWVRPLLVGGVLGGFTTFSAVAVEFSDLATDRPSVAAVYVVASFVVGVLAVAAGRMAVRRRTP